MKNDKLFYNDPYINKTQSRILAVKYENGHSLIALDQTIFYPGGGGQLPDKGKINSFPVEKIILDDGLVWHKVSSDSDLSKGMEVAAEIDWPCRYYNMQQHSGQHLVSYVLFKYNFQTVSVHLGEEYTLVEIENGFPDEDKLKAVEYECNRLINKAVSIKNYWITQDKISQYPLRRAAGNRKKIRIVEIDGYDFAACGGTHVNNTSEIGLIKVIAVEKIRNHARIKIVIGIKAYEYFNQIHKITNELKIELPSDLQNISIRVQQLKNNVRSLEKEKQLYQNLYIEKLCRSFSDTGEKILFYQFKNSTSEDLQLLARCIKERSKICAFIVSGNRFCFVANEENKEITQTFLTLYKDDFSIKGGGPLGFIQGTIGKLNVEDIYTALNGLEKDIKENIRLTM